LEILIRSAKSEEAEAYAGCVIACWQAAYRDIVPAAYLQYMSAHAEEWVDKYKKALADPGGGYYCAMHGDKMAGFLILDWHRAENFWAIYLVAEFWGMGYGKQILDFAISELSRAGHREVRLWVFEENHRARRFYEKNGFGLDGVKRVVDKYGGVPLVELGYALRL